MFVSFIHEETEAQRGAGKIAQGVTEGGPPREEGAGPRQTTLAQWV